MMHGIAFLFSTAGITLIACVSPLLTLAWLFQLKEWRIDRLREQLNREGYLTTLFGRVRPLILVVFVIGWLSMRFAATRLTSAEEGFSLLGYFVLWILGTLVLLALASLVPIVRRRQRMPRWTMKATTVTSAALLFDALAISLLIIRFYPFLPFLAVAQPLVLGLAWIIFLPLDRLLKHRILARAATVRAKHDVIAIGITGSVGKTTTKELIAHLLADRKPLVTPKHVNTEMGVAQWITKELSKLPTNNQKQEARTLVIEMGAYAKGEIATLCRIVQPTMGIITYIGTQHLALFGSQQKLIEAKGELLQALPTDGHAFINGDCPPCRDMRALCRCPVTIVGTADADAVATNLRETDAGLSFTFDGTSFHVPIHGAHNITNLLLAIAVARQCGMDLPEIRNRLQSFTLPDKTFTVREQHGVTILDDTHNASEASVAAAIDWAKSRNEPRKILLTTGIIELGDAEARIHEELGARASGVFDDVVFLSPRLAAPFEKGYGKPLIPHVALRPGDLLVCIGRLPPSAISRLLPSSEN